MNTLSIIPIQPHRYSSEPLSEELEHATLCLQRMSLDPAITRVVTGLFTHLATPLLCFDFMSGYNYPVVLYQKKSIVLYRGTPETILRHAVQHARMRQYRHMMPKALIALMEKSLLLIERSNRRHREDVPAAVILQGAFDSSGAPCSLTWISQLEQLAKTYYIALQILGCHENFATAIRDAKQEVGKRNIMTLLVRAHGNRTFVQFSPVSRYTTTDVRASDFACLDPRASIILSACKTGLGLAPLIAAVQPNGQTRPVFAATEEMTYEYFTPCCDAHGYGMLAFDLRWRQIAKKFQRHENVVRDTNPCCASDETIKRVRYVLFQRKQEVADQGDAHTQYELGKMYRDGRGVVQSHRVAVYWFRKAVGLAGAQTDLGVAYRKGQGVAQSNHTALYWFRRAASQGDATAQYNLGVMYRDGRGVTQSYNAAMQWYMQAAAQRYPQAQNDIAVLYWEGQGVPQSHATAVRWLRQAANQGHKNAQYSLSIAYARGLGISQSHDLAIEWLRRAAIRGHMDAQFQLGGLYHFGEGVTQSYSTAIKWFQQPARHGHAVAQYNVGVAYHEGLGVVQSYNTAVEWFGRAAEQGHMNAQYNLGIAYLRGRGVTQSNDEARRWLQRAAAQGSSDAQQVLLELV